jgi:hypothetical protein
MRQWKLFWMQSLERTNKVKLFWIQSIERTNTDYDWPTLLERSAYVTPFTYLIVLIRSDHGGPSAKPDSRSLKMMVWTFKIPQPQNHCRDLWKWFFGLLFEFAASKFEIRYSILVDSDPSKSPAKLKELILVNHLNPFEFFHCKKRVEVTETKWGE